MKMSVLFNQFYATKRKLSKGKDWEILMVKLGDYYESFFEDAKKISRECNIATDYRVDENGNTIEHITIRADKINDHIKTLESAGYTVLIATEN